MGPSLLVATALSAVYLVWEPSSADLAAQTFRADLFADQGFTLWSTAWYGGFHVPGYSLLYPPLAAWFGVRVVGAVAAVAAASLFAALTARHFGKRALPGSVCFAVGVGAWLFTGRMPFLLGLAIGLGALLAAEGRRLALTAVLAGLSALASPVAGLFTALAGAALLLTGDRRVGAALALPAGIAIVAMAAAFPTGGEEPFVLGSFVPVPLFAIIALWLIPAEQRVVRAGIVLYAALAVVVFVIPNPLGGNLSRLAALFAAPLLLLAVWRRPAVIVAFAVPLLYWQLSPAIRDTTTALGDPSTEARFYAPLLDELDRDIPAVPGHDALRIQVPPTRNRWEAVYVAEEYPLARGWMRQLESDDFDLFEDGNLTPDTYQTWLSEHGVSYVAVPDGVEPDHLAEDEVDLIDAGLPYLELEWQSEDWKLYRVAGEPLVRYRWTPYWQVTGGEGCVESDGDWTRVEPSDGGELEIAARFSLGGLLGRDRVCSG
jgi:hypothetical protein